MFASQFLSPPARAMALVQRRLKWHTAEYNRIVASWASLSTEAQEVAQEAKKQHRIAAMECEHILQAREPEWGNERDITERFLEPQSEEALAVGLA